MKLTPRFRVSYWQLESLWAYFFISPWLIGFVIFTAGAMIASMYFSLTRWDGLTPAVYVGLENYYHILMKDPLVPQSLKVTFLYALGSVPLNLVVGLLVALLMNQKVSGIRLFRTIYYLPAVIGGVAVAVAWKWMLNGQFGILNLLLSFVGIKGPNWLFDIDWVIPAYLIVNLWQVGAVMLINLAALQGIPTELYEAAEIDGCNVWSKFWHITIPGISAVLFFNLVMGIITNFRIFTQALVLTNGAPANASLFYVIYLYRNAFQTFRMGYASALAWVLFFIILALTAIVIKSSPYWVYYEAELKR